MPNNEQDDLTAIKGIGHRTATALGDELGVDGFAALSAQTVDEISDALANAGLRRQPYAVIEVWIAEATQRSAVVKSAIEESGGAESPTTALHDWRNEASFVVEFESRDVVHQVVEHEHQMVVHEIETDIGERFAVDDGAGAFRWMLHQVEAARHAKADAERGVTAAAPVPAKEFVPDIGQALSVSYIELDQPPHLSKASADQAPENRNLGVARVRTPLAFRVGFTIDDEHVDALAEAGVVYTAEVYVHAWAGDDTVRIGPTDPGLLTSGTGDYELVIRHSFDAVGLYRVRAVVNLTTETPVGDYLEAAMLQVY